MEKKYDVNELTAEQRAVIEKVEAIITDEQNQEKFKEMRTADDVIAFYEEKGFSYSEDDKKNIRDAFDELKAKVGDGELSEEDLEKIAGGWSWGNFWSGFGGGGVVGAVAGGLTAAVLGSNPVGWAIGGALVLGGILGAGIGAAE